ncbi:MAG: hypothetical protein LBK67_04365, partial [Coriobacteriales bacterium]|nr:hypothetical protein [Coriobacteriales bacterium]
VVDSKGGGGGKARDDIILSGEKCGAFWLLMLARTYSNAADEGRRDTAERHRGQAQSQSAG